MATRTVKQLFAGVPLTEADRAVLNAAARCAELYGPEDGAARLTRHAGLLRYKAQMAYWNARNGDALSAKWNRKAERFERYAAQVLASARAAA